MAEDRARGFGATVLSGLAIAALAAVAGTKPWVSSGPSGGQPPGGTAMLGEQGLTYPVASAVALVLLAAWGVLLVTRGTVRQLFAWLALIAVLALLGTVVAGYVDLRDTSASTFDQRMGRAGGPRALTGWFWTTAVCAVVALVPAVLAVRRARSWPEMGRRYDAPGSGVPTRQEQTERDLWTELDEGRDPTAD